MATIRITVDALTAKVYFTFDQSIIDAIKTVPGRRYIDAGSNGGKYWSVPASQAQAVQDLLTSTGHQVILNGATASPTDDSTIVRLQNEVKVLEQRNRQLVQESHRLKREAEARKANWAEQLLGRCPAELEDRVFRALTRVLHPDAGGDNDLMRDLNVARDQLARV